MLPKATNTPERLDTITGAQREDSGDGMLSKLLLSIGRCSSGNHDGNSSSGSCMTTAIDMAGDGESAGGGGAAHEVMSCVCGGSHTQQNFWPLSHLQARFLMRVLQLRPRRRQSCPVTWPRWSDCAWRRERSFAALRTFRVDLRTISRLLRAAEASPSWEDAPRRETLKTVLIFLQLPVIE